MKKTDWGLIAPVVAIAVIMVLLPLKNVGDVYYFAKAARTILQGGLIYRDVEFTYPPIYAYLMAAVMLLLGDNSFALKFLPVAFHLATGVVIFERLKSWPAFYMYLLSPLPFLVSAIWGNFDVVAGFFTVLALVLIARARYNVSALSLAIGINLKYFPVILLIPILAYLKKGRVVYLGIIAIVSLLVNAPFMLLAWNGWLQQVLVFQLSRPPSGYSVYSLATGSLNGGPSEVGLLLPLALAVLFLVFYSRREQLLQLSALFMTATVIFNKVVLWYGQWFVPLVVLCYREVRQDILLVAALFLSQIIVYLGPAVFGDQNSTVLAFGWFYQATTAVLAWRLIVNVLKRSPRSV